MMMSSCSQENIESQPHTENLLIDANSKANVLAGSGVLGQLPSIPVTDGSQGVEIFPTGWSKVVNVVPDGLPEWAAGTSSLTHLWGSAVLPWVTPLGSPDGNANSIVTFQRQKNVIISGGTQSFVSTKIKNLIPGKKYAVTFSFATTILSSHGESTQYAQSISVNIPGSLGGNTQEVDMVGKEAAWVSKSIVFIAQSTEANVNINISLSQNYYESHDSFLQYAHVYVGKNAVQKL